ncbi:MAG: response regulator [Lentisphaeraceae bacterium]|nr:response regulator [Lentisphaeraceae bacterium]
MSNVLFIDDEPHILHAMKLAFKNEDLKLFLADGPDKALNILRQNNISVIISDNMMPGTNGIDLLTKARKISPNSIRILLTGHCDEDCIIKSINAANVYKFITKPFSASSIVKLVKNGVQAYKECQLIGKIKKGNINLIQAIQRHTTNNMNFECQWLVPTDLQIGMILVEDLKNSRDVLLMKKGRSLSMRDLQLIKSLEIKNKLAVRI